MIWVNATDAYGAETNVWYTFTTKNAPWENTCPVSTNISPGNESTSVSITVGQWSVTITDADGNTTNGNITCSNGDSMNWSNKDNGTQTLNLSSLNYNTKYTINLNYTDGHCTLNKTYWFTTAQQSTNNNPGGGGTTGGGGSGGIPPPTNQNPIANATVDKNTGYPGEIFIFNASASQDDDGEIVNYTWNFDDGVNSSTNQTTITHKFTSTGVYHVMLTVIDEKGGTGSLKDPIIIDIIQANNPPKNLVVIPEDDWTHKNNDITFMMSATDQDYDETLRFEIDWGDGNTTVSEQVNSSQIYKISHAWDTYGSYPITVIAYDNDNASTETVTITMLVDIQVLDDLNGWIIDSDGDGQYDQYKDLTNSRVSNLQQQDTGTYLIDINNDGIWDYDYQLTNDDITPHNQIKQNDNDGSFPLWAIAIILILGILSLIGILFFLGIINIEYEE
jgi:PKD repeat protein